MPEQRPTYPMLRVNGTSPAAEVALVVNNLARGFGNFVWDIPIAADAATAVLDDVRIHPACMVLVEPGSSITGRTVLSGLLTLTVIPGPERTEKVCVLG